MRTVTFSRPTVQALLDDRFVSTWFNQAPDIFPEGSGDPQKTAYPQNYYDKFPDGAGGANVKLFFCTPDGKIVHFTQGYLKAETLKVEAEFALRLLKMKKPTKARLKAAHQARVKDLQRQLKKLQSKACKQTRENALAQSLLNIRVYNHQLAQERLLQDPESYMINEDFGIS